MIGARVISLAQSGERDFDKLRKYATWDFRLAAARELLDRGFGKAAQARITEAIEAPITVTLLQYSDLERNNSISKSPSLLTDCWQPEQKP